MKIRDLIGQEVNITYQNTLFSTTGILLDIDDSGILIEVKSTMVPRNGSDLPYSVGDIVYLKDKGFHLAKTKAMERDIKLDQLVGNAV